VRIARPLADERAVDEADGERRGVGIGECASHIRLEGGASLAEAGKEVAERVLETDRRLDRGMDDCVVLVREQLDARERRAGENLRKRVVASGRTRALRNTGKVAPRNLRDGVPGRTVEPDQV